MVRLQLPYRFNLLARYEDSTWPLRFEAIRLALRMDGDRDRERLNFMTEQRFFQYSCQQAETRGNIQALDWASVTTNHVQDLEQMRRMCDAYSKELTGGMERLRKSYLARDNEYFYWGD